MEAQENNPPPYSVVCQDPSSYFVRYDVQSNQVNITTPQEAIAMQHNENAGRVVSYQMVPVVSPRKEDLTFQAIAICFCCCCFTGIPAIFYASEAQSEYGAGNILKAEKNQKLARRWITVSQAGCVLFWICLLFGVVMILGNMFSTYMFYNTD